MKTGGKDRKKGREFKKVKPPPGWKRFVPKESIQY